MSLKIGFCVLAAFLVWLYSTLTIERNKDWKDEISFFNSTLKYHPNNTRLYLNMGNTFYERGEVDKAIEQYEKCIAIDKNYAIAYGNIGSAYMNKNNYTEAEKFLKTAITLQEKYPIAHYNLGVINLQKGKYPEAIKELETATQQLPQLYQAWNALARAYTKTGQKQKALEAIKMSKKINPNQK